MTAGYFLLWLASKKHCDFKTDGHKMQHRLMARMVATRTLTLTDYK